MGEGLQLAGQTESLAVTESYAFAVFVNSLSIIYLGARRAVMNCSAPKQYMVVVARQTFWFGISYHKLVVQRGPYAQSLTLLDVSIASHALRCSTYNLSGHRQ